MSFTIAVCNEEKLCRKSLIMLLQKYNKSRTLSFEIKEFQHGNDLIDSNARFDIIFLDIFMENSIARIIRESDPLAIIIFLTDHSIVNIESFQVHAFSYIEKPIVSSVFYKQLDEAILLSKHIYRNETRSSNEITFYANKIMTKFLTEDIYYFELKHRKVNMYTKTAVYIIEGTISSLEKMMIPFGFAVPHQSFIINLNAIEKLEKLNIHMNNGDIIPLSQKRSAHFRKKMQSYLRIRV